jgi:nucleoside-diphosphate-sugar epimerase
VAGDVGGFVARELAEHDHEVIGVDLRPAGDAPLADMREADIESRAALESAFRGCDAVVHLAALREPGLAADDTVFRVNTMGTFNALEAAVANSARRFVLASSEAVLGVSFAERALAPAYAPIDDEHPLLPQDCYGLSKLAGEELCRGFARRGSISTICLRTCYVWSLAWREDAIGSILDPSRGARGLWAYVHAEDAARAYRLACEVEGVDHASMFVAAADTRSLVPTAQLLADHYPGTALTRPVGEFESVIASQRAQEVLGFSPAHSWRDELAEGDLDVAAAPL